VRIAFSHEETCHAVFHHFGNSCESRGDAGDPCGHGFHEHGGEIIHATVVFRSAGESKDGGRMQRVDDFVLGHSAAQGDAVCDIE
jgi:hypothetical protein